MAQVIAKADSSATSYFTGLLHGRWGWLIYVLACLIPGQLVAYWGILYFGHDWDKGLIKPSVTQFNWLFFVLVWVINYSVMGVAA